MADLFEKCFSFTRDPYISENGMELGIADAISWGVYPYFKAISALNGPHCTVDGRDAIMVGSNNYLGLTTHPKVKQAAMKALEEYGTSCSGSRFLNGTLDLHEKLEASLARFVGKEAALGIHYGLSDQSRSYCAAPHED